MSCHTDALKCIFNVRSITQPLSPLLCVSVCLWMMGHFKLFKGVYLADLCFRKQNNKTLLNNEETESRCFHSTEERAEKHATKLEADNEKLRSEINKLQQELNARVNLEQKLHEQIAKTRVAEARLKEEEKAKQDALTRLSEQISLKFADNNPNIADLSDINRPTNLAERFSMLYDDQWTEAFDALQKLPAFQDEEKTISQLLEFLMVCFRMCHEQAIRQLTVMFSVNNTVIPPEQIPTEMKKPIKETRKKHAAIYFSALQTLAFDLLGKEYRELLDNEAVNAYIKSSIELCWLMCVQDPPMSLLLDVGKDGKYDKCKFREYTKVGPYIDYIVWPAVLIQEGGDMMSKGLAQYCDEISEDNKQKGTRVSTETTNETNVIALTTDDTNVKTQSKFVQQIDAEMMIEHDNTVENGDNLNIQADEKGNPSVTETQYETEDNKGREVSMKNDTEFMSG